MVTVGKYSNVKTKTTSKTKKKNMFLHNFQFASVFKLPCYVFSQKSTDSCARKLEISGNSNLQPAFTRCGLEALADNLVLM